MALTGKLVPEDRKYPIQVPSVRCARCGLGMGGLVLRDGEFVHRDPESCPQGLSSGPV